MANAARVLYVADHGGFVRRIGEQLNLDGSVEFEQETTIGDAVGRTVDRFDCIVSSFDLSDGDGLELLERVRSRDPYVPFILVVEDGSETIASEAISAGVTEYISCDGNGDSAKVANCIESVVEDPSDQLHREIFENAQIGLALHDPASGHVIEANDAYAELLGYNDSEAVIGLAPEAFAHSEAPFTADRARKHIRETLTDGPTSLEWQVDTPEGDRIWVEVGLTGITVAGRSHVLATVRAIEERKEREAALRRQERRYQAMFNDPNILVGVLDLDGTFLDVNQTALEYVDVEKDDVIGKPLWETAWFEDTPEVKVQLQSWVAKARTGKYVPFELDLQCQNGEQYTVAGVFRPVTDETGEVVSVIISDRDVTERKQRERDLAERTQQLEGVLDGVKAAIWMRDPESQFILVNEEYRDLFGIAADTDVTRAPLGELVGEEPAAKLRENDAEAWAAGEPVEIEKTIPTEYGEREFLTHITPLYTDAGEPYATVGIAVDITAQKQQELELRQFRQAVEASGHAVYFADEDGRIEYVNPAYEEIIGFTGGEAIGRIPPALQREACEGPPAHVVWETVRSGETWRGEVVYESAPDDRYVLDQTIAPIVAEDGEITHFVATAADITGKRERQRQLERYETIVETTGDAIYTLDDEGHLTYVNDAFTEVTGYDKAELLGSHISMVMAEPDVEEGRQLIRSLLSGKQDSGMFEMDLITARGERILCENHIAVLPFTGDFRGTAGVIRDITARKQREQQVQVLNRVLRHNFRNELTIVRGYVNDLIDEGERSADTSTFGLEAIDRLIDLCEKVRHLDPLLDPGTSPEPVDLTRILADVVAEIESSYPNAEISVGSPEDPVVEAAPVLGFAIRELIENAIKHGGEAPCVDVTVQDVADGIRIEVADDGAGLSGQNQTVLTDGTERPLVHGDGVGLWLVYWIVTNHNGAVDVNAGDAGTTVAIQLPGSPVDPAVRDDPTVPHGYDRYRAVFEAANEGMLILTDDGNIVDANAAAARLVGAEAGTLLGREIYRFATDADTCKQEWQTVTATDRHRGTFVLSHPEAGDRRLEYSAVTDVIPGHHIVIFRDPDAQSAIE